MRRSMWLAGYACAQAGQIALLYMPFPARKAHESGMTAAAPNSAGNPAISHPPTKSANPAATDSPALTPSTPTPSGSSDIPASGPSSSAKADHSATQATPAGTALPDSLAASLRATLLRIARCAPPHTDKFVHGTIFAATTFTAACAFSSRRQVTRAVLGNVLHALLAEHLQARIPGRGYDRADTYVNLIGVSLGAGGAALICRQ
ncbi:hypothetical protein [Trueperella sp. LYQ143]|uniref:hypothetical protein n=1 Tax=Trueperella sp. LYQ143 TaxID=3391059 RepID=UPI003983163F